MRCLLPTWLAQRIDDTPPEKAPQDDIQVDALWRVFDELATPQEPRMLVEAWHDLLQAVSELQDRFVLGLSTSMPVPKASACIWPPCAFAQSIGYS